MSQSRAMGKVKLGMSRLAFRYPFQAGILACMKITEDSAISTMAIGYSQGRLTLYFSPAYATGITLDEVEAVLSHEALHVILDHVNHVPEDGEDRQARTIAEEVSVNALVFESLPGKPLLLEHYPFLPQQDATTDDRYKRLKAETVPQPEPQTLDEHSTWQQITEHGPLAALAATAAITGAWGGLTPDQQAATPQVLVRAAKEAVQALSSGGSIDWRLALRRYVGRSLTRRTSYARPNRRFPELLGVIKGRGKTQGKPHILAAIDTSGSISQADIASFSAELGRMASWYAVTVVFFDDKIQKVFPYAPFTEVIGRGGTDFRPILSNDFLRKHRVDVAIVFTDGYGPTDVKPYIPVVWAITNRGRCPVEWGKVIKINGS